MKNFPGTRMCLYLALLLLPNSLLASDVDQSLVATTPHFAFYSYLATNLHDALIVAGADRNKEKPELFPSQPIQEDNDSCFAGLPPSAQTGWNLAVDYYAEVISPNSWLSRQQYQLRVELAGVGEELDARAQSFVDIARGFRATAKPAYEACRWTVQDRENRDWIDDLTPHLAIHESAVTSRLEQLYQTPWHGLPIRVDVVATAPPVGANTIGVPPHILVSSEIKRGDALEIIHHEGSHTLMTRNHPMQKALVAAARELKIELPPDLWHVVLFYTTGEAMRDILHQSGAPDYTPYIYSHDLWSGRWGTFREAVEKTWPAYLKGTRTLAEAASDLLEALVEPDDTLNRALQSTGRSSHRPVLNCCINRC